MPWFHVTDTALEVRPLSHCQERKLQLVWRAELLLWYPVCGVTSGKLYFAF